MSRRLNLQLRRLYGRWGARGLILFCAVGAGLSAAVNTLMVVIFVVNGYLDASLEDTVKLAVLAEAGLAGGLLFGRSLTAKEIRACLSWSGSGRTSARAPEIWRQLVAVPRTVVTRVGITLFVIEIVGLALAARYLDEPPNTLLPGYATVVAATAANCVFVMFGVETVLRPMLMDVASKLPADFGPEVRTASLRAKLLAPMPGATVFAGMFVGAYTFGLDSPAARMGGALAIALGLAALSVAMFWLVTRSALDPVEHLTDATRRVREGDLSTPVPVTTGDELGGLAQSFNEMMDEIKTSRARIVAASDEARSKVERDLHDGAQQHLVLMNLKLGMLERAAIEDPGVAALAAEIRADLDTALGELRDLAHGIYPAVLDNSGLVAALREAGQRAALPVTVEAEENGRFPGELEAAVYFCCLEALQNAGKYAGNGASARVSLARANGRLSFEVADDGAGFDSQTVAQSAGMQNMADRIGALGGELRVQSSPGEGTRISGSLPLAD